MPAVASVGRPRVKALLRSHLAAFAFFVPFAAMLTIHRMLGLSDAFMVAPAPGQPHSMLYNLLMILAFYFWCRRICPTRSCHCRAFTDLGHRQMCAARRLVGWHDLGARLVWPGRTTWFLR